jgi:hypothetical protein
MTFCPDDQVGPTSKSTAHWATDYAKNVSDTIAESANENRRPKAPANLAKT